MTQSTDRDITEIKNAVDANSKAIADLTSSITGLREEMRVGFTKLEGQINKSELSMLSLKNEPELDFGVF
jgi:hypothetical protein